MPGVFKEEQDGLGCSTIRKRREKGWWGGGNADHVSPGDLYMHQEGSLTGSAGKHHDDMGCKRTAWGLTVYYTVNLQVAMRIDF